MESADKLQNAYQELGKSSDQFIMHRKWAFFLNHRKQESTIIGQLPELQ